MVSFLDAGQIGADRGRKLVGTCVTRLNSFLLLNVSMNSGEYLIGLVEQGWSSLGRLLTAPRNSIVRGQLSRGGS